MKSHLMGVEAGENRGVKGVGSAHLRVGRAVRTRAWGACWRILTWPQFSGLENSVLTGQQTALQGKGVEPWVVT